MDQNLGANESEDTALFQILKKNNLNTHITPTILCFQEASEQEKARLVRFTEEKNNEILHFNNQLAQLQTRLDKAQSNAVKWESKWTHIQNTAAKKTLLLGRIKIAIHNLYQVRPFYNFEHIFTTATTIHWWSRIRVSLKAPEISLIKF